MDKKIRLGINFFFNNSNNSGIVNYIYNIISALKTLPAAQQPQIVVFYSNDAPIDFIKEIGYRGIDYILFNPYPSNKVIRKINHIIKRFTKTDYFLKWAYYNKVDVLYPYFGFSDELFAPIKNKIYWLVDFNNRAFPQHYEDGGKFYLDFQQKLTNTDKHIVLSSNALFNELKLYYPYYKNKVSVLKFACSLPDLSNHNIVELRKKFNIDGGFFISPNQFWEHKNQMVVIEALRVLKDQNKLNFKVVFTGSMAVNRGKGHMLEKLEAVINTYSLRENVAFLGIVDRTEQLVLMKYAKGLIQPSLYEGWSTLVEEAKVLNQHIALSDIPVHREQNCPNSHFFEPNNAQQLAGTLINIMGEPVKKTIDYRINIENFGKDMLNIIKDELQ